MPKHQVIEMEHVEFGDDDFQTIIAAILLKLLEYQPSVPDAQQQTARYEPGDF